MSILIKNMEMPKNCGECPFATPTRDGLMCDAVNFLAKCLIHPISRMSCCPLIELPPHGDLIDRDAAMKAACEALCHLGVFCPDNLCKEVRETFDAVPTIIESEGEE